MTSAAEDDESRVSAGTAAHEGYGVGRLLAFSDGVFAVAITLLVFSIPTPEVPPGPDLNARLASALAGLRPNLLGFGLSFVLVGTQWMVHHRMLRQLSFTNGRVLGLNLLILLGISLVPFQTSLLVHYGDTATGVIAYAAWQTFIGVAFLVMRLYLGAWGPGHRALLLFSLVQVGGFALSMPVALLGVQWAYALWVTSFVASRIREARTGPAAR